ncbi:O-methyltransferase [Cohnella faecalis]|uniref:O-methyltransferase n=1 Tax=Cohnella faecalis TaxID=2315694 RepID=A0A398CUR7_9BACL|nr:O-methyltransferase [Cohnella faecalis]RIE02744.1 O-methyltransferase [Cohnella faecalis]
MGLSDVSLARQVDIALEKLEGELKGLTAGTIVLQIREDTIGKFGIRHLPMDCEEDSSIHSGGMTEAHVRLLRRMAVDALKRKRGWTYGEILYDFGLKRGKVYVSVQFESNYNMANLMFRFTPKRRDHREIAGE